MKLPFRDSLMLDRSRDEETGEPRIEIAIAADYGETVRFVMEVDNAEELGRLILQLCGEARTEAGLVRGPSLGLN